MQEFNQSFMVVSMLEDQRLVVYTRITTPQSVCSDSMAKVFFSLCQRRHFQYILRYACLVTAEALQGGADCADHQRCLTAATSTYW